MIPSVVAFLAKMLDGTVVVLDCVAPTYPGKDGPAVLERGKFFNARIDPFRSSHHELLLFRYQCSSRSAARAQAASIRLCLRYLAGLR